MLFNKLFKFSFGALLICMAHLIYADDAGSIDMTDYNRIDSLGTMSLSISSDAHYAVSSNLANQVILWDLQKHTHKIISNHANIYSAYFIKHSPYFMWQSLPQHQLQLGTSYGLPPQQQLVHVSHNTMSIISKIHGKYYIYFYVADQGNISKHIEKKLIPYSIFNHFYLNNLDDGINFSASPYTQKFVIDKDLSSKERLIQLLITLGYHSGNIVHVQNPAGKQVLQFDNFPVYGQVMRSNLKDYFASTFNWNLFKGYGDNQHLMMLDDNGFYIGKLLNLTLNDKKPYLLSSGDAESNTKIVLGKNEIWDNFKSGIKVSMLRGVTLWNADTGKPLHKFVADLYAKTYATLSPDGNYIIAADEDARNYVWSTKTFKRLFQLWFLYDGKVIGYDKSGGEIYTKKGLHMISPPKGYAPNSMTSDMIYSIKFIDQTHYLRIAWTEPYAILYKVDSPRPLKYFYLGNNPLPAMNDYQQNEAIDSSPSKHILVIAMIADHSGILEYKYDPKKMTLKRIWVGHFPAKEAEDALDAYKKAHTSKKTKPQSKPWYRSIF